MNRPTQESPLTAVTLQSTYWPWDASPVESVGKVEVIFVHVERGEGTAESPKRSVYQYWSLDGRFLAERDMAGETGGGSGEAV